MIQYDVWTHSSPGILQFVHLRPAVLRPTLWTQMLTDSEVGGRGSCCSLRVCVPCLKQQYVSAFVIRHPEGAAAPCVHVCHVWSSSMCLPLLSDIQKSIPRDQPGQTDWSSYTFCVGMCQNPYITTSFFKTKLILTLLLLTVWQPLLSLGLYIT